MKPYYLLILLTVVFASCNTYAPSYSGPYQGRSVGSNLPAKPDPDKCYVRAVSPDEYETYTSTYLTYTPAEADEYPHKVIQLEVVPEISRWEATAYEGCESDDPNDCQVLCYRTYPAKYVTIYEPIDTSQGNPQLKVVEFEELVRKGGLTEYVEIDCELTSFNRLPISFSPNSAALSGENSAIVDQEIYGLLKELPNIRLQINVHTDSRGASATNMDLSERRSKSIADYLVGKGINRSRLILKGLGESQLINRCADGVNCSEAEHAQNERVEFRVINVDV